MDINSNPYQQFSAIQQQLNNINGLIGNPQPVKQQEIHIVRVKGRDGANAYQMPPNSDAILADIDEPIVWVVQTDGAGYKTITPFDLSQHKEVKQEDLLKSIETRLKKLEEVILNGKSDFSTVGANNATRQSKGNASSRSNGDVQG